MKLKLIIYIAYLYYDNSTNCNSRSPSILEPITDIPCDAECGAGEYLAVDTMMRDYNC
jgi:hypothetical protein